MEGSPEQSIDFRAAYQAVAGLGVEAFTTECELGQCIEKATLEELGLIALRNTGDSEHVIVGTPEELDVFAKGWLQSRGLRG